jgi:hypothetical protein
MIRFESPEILFGAEGSLMTSDVTELTLPSIHTNAAPLPGFPINHRSRNASSYTLIVSEL